jgi:putative transposase
LFFLHVQTRRVIVCTPTLHPTHAWSRERAVEFVETARDQGFCSPTILIRDGDGKFGPGFNEALRERGCMIKRLPVRSPQLNAFAERWVRTVRRECLDHFVACGERHLEFLITEFLRHYHEQRPHQGVGNRLLVREPRRPGIHPSSPPIRAGPDATHVPRVVCRKSLGGVLKHYERKVA